MKPMTVTILAGSLLLAALPALAASPADSSPYVRTASVDESAATAYLNNADWQFTAWDTKMADLDMGIINKSVTMSAEAKTDVDKAWDNLKLRWTQLRTVNARDWDSARAAWETAVESMQKTWQHLVPQQG
jgi:hypothetical protein